MDSNSDMSNEFSFNFKNTTVYAKGPKLDSLRNNMMTKMQVPHNPIQPRNTDSVFDQRSVYSRRETSPMSIRSLYDFQSGNFNYPHGISTQSVYNGRCRSPMSMCSTSSASATEIAMAFQYAQFNKLDVEIIKKAYNNIFIRRFKDSDSGEQGSDSSLSSEDNRSTRNCVYKKKTSSYKSSKKYLPDFRISRQKGNMYKDCSANFRQNPLRNIHAIDTNNLTNNFHIKSVNDQPLQKDRFKSRCLLPSQRFNRSNVVSTIKENISKVHPNVGNMNRELKNNNNVTSGTVQMENFVSESDHDEIFSTVTAEKNIRREAPYKRKFDQDETTHIANKKRQKLSPIKNIPDNTLTTTQPNIDNIQRSDTVDFVFVKPSFPLKRLGNTKVEETLISKSAKPSVDVVPIPDIDSVPHKHETVDKTLSDPTEQSVSNVSMRPSFIKRKLFTQKLDIIENKNTSSDNLNSPIVSSKIQKEKNKTRKLISSQLCLNRDVVQEDNFMDLIHKIVPPSQINSTNQSNKAVVSKRQDVGNKWDVTSIISGCKSEDESDTFTDEDMFQQSATDNTKKNKLKNQIKKIVKDCRIVIEKHNVHVNTSSNAIAAATTINEHKIPKTSNKEKEVKSKDIKNKSMISANTFWGTNLESDFECQDLQKKIPEPLNKNKVSDNKNKSKICVNTFWDTDLESDFECHNLQKNVSETPNICSAEIPTKKEESREMPINKKLDKTTSTFDNTLTFDNTTEGLCKFNTVSLRIRSHRASKKMKCCMEPDVPMNKVLNSSIKIKYNNSQHYNCVSKNTTNNNNKQVEVSKPKQLKNIDRNKSLRSGEIVLSKSINIDKVCTNKKTDKCTKTAPVAKIKLNQDIIPSDSDVSFTLTSEKKLPANNNTKTHRRQQKNIPNKHIDPTQSLSDLSFSLLEPSIITRSKKRTIAEFINNSTLNNTNNKYLATVNATQKSRTNKKDGKSFKGQQNSHTNKNKSVRKR